MDKVKKWKCSECGFPASDAGIVRAHQGRIHHGFGTIEHNDTEVIDMITERPEGTQGDLESPEAPAEALRQLRRTFNLVLMANYPGTTASNQFLDDLLLIVTTYAATVEREAAIKAVKHLVDHYKANASYGYSDSGEWLVDAEEYLEELQSNENT